MASTSAEIAIVGAGPSGCALACFLCQRGAEVVIFDNGTPPDLLVGESLIPAAIPLLQRLGVEEQVKAVSMLKPGASLQHASGQRVDFEFRLQRGKAPGYAYNVPRPAFDNILRERARALGARFVHQRALLSRGNPASSDGEISLSDASLDAAGLTPDGPSPLLIDATGRAHLFARVLGIEATRGGRDDTAYFAHYENCALTDAPSGQIIITVLKYGWSWRIPLKNRLSIGVVISREVARRFGDTAQARLDAIIQDEPMLATCVSGGRRVSPVRTYSNYQLLHQRGFGPGWAMVGDAFGFVDPMLSPGVFMALESASLLDRCIALNHGRIGQLSFDRYNREIHHWHDAWQEIIAHFYDGSLLRLHEAGKDSQDGAGRFSHVRVLNWYYQRLIGQLVSGTGTRSAFKRRMLKAGIEHLADSTVKSERHAVMGDYSPG
ncbi:MAG: NAD(P)/FAD-dependent oxidoreductase [Granulosicoccus sp.]